MKGEERRVMSNAVKRRGCENFADRLVDYSDGELAEGERQVVGEHLALCPGCRAELARLDASLLELNHAIQSEDRHERSVRLAERVGPARVLSMPRMAGWTAALVCLGGTVWFSLRMISEPSDLANRWVVLRKTQAPVVDVFPAPAGTELNVPRRVSPQDALWRIAMIEQEARLAAALELLPRDGVYAAQREKDEQLLAKYQAMVRMDGVQ